MQPARGEADSAIAGLFPAEVVALRASAAMWDAPLPPAEAAHVARAVPKRRREFAAGRHCARQALAQLGVRDFALHPDAERVPLWPEGFVGSISHCEGFCGVVVTRSERFAGIGFDVEGDEPLSADLLDTICTPTERRWIASCAAAAIDWPKLLFSAKECFYKCYFPLARRTSRCRPSPSSSRSSRYRPPPWVSTGSISSRPGRCWPPLPCCARRS